MFVTRVRRKAKKTKKYQRLYCFLSVKHRTYLFYVSFVKISQYSFNERHDKMQASIMCEVQQSKYNITIKTTKYLGLIRVFIQHVFNKITRWIGLKPQICRISEIE